MMVRDRVVVLLFALVLAVHLLCVNVAAGAPLVAFGCEWGDARGSAIARRIGRYLTVAGLAGLFVGLLFGLILIALQWSPTYAVAFDRLRNKLLAGVAELVFSAVLYGIGVWLWRGDSPSHPWVRRLRGFIALVNGTNLLYHFPLLFLVLNRTLREGNAEQISNAEFRRLAFSGEVPAMAVHVVFASLAMAGVALFGLALRRGRQDAASEETDSIARWGARVALLPTLGQIPVGLWIMSTLPPGDQSRLMGGSTPAFLCFIAGTAAAIWFLQQLATINAGDTDRRTLLKSMALSAAVVVLMTIAWRLAKAV